MNGMWKTPMKVDTVTKSKNHSGIDKGKNEDNVSSASGKKAVVQVYDSNK